MAPKIDDDGVPRIGIVPGNGFDFPFQVHVNIDPDVGGPSAGLMFSLAIFDTLTPGSLTGDAAVAGTGTMSEDGSVGPIGGIQQKIVGARDDGAELFLVPPTTAQTRSRRRTATCGWCGPTPCTTRWRRSRPGSTTPTRRSRRARTSGQAGSEQ